jgi:hypothetical protein
MRKSISGLVTVVLFVAGGGICAASPYSDLVLSDNPILYYQFEELNGTTAVDSSPTGANGTYLGGVQLQQVSGEAGLGSAADFDGFSGWVDVPALGSFPQVTIETWLNLEGNPAGGCCTSIYSNDSFGGGNIHFNIKSGRDIEHAVAGGGPNNRNTPAGTIQSNVWYHVVATYDSTAGGDTHIYVDGVEMSNLPHGGAPQAALVDAQIARWGNARYFDGKLDEFAIYDSVLSAEQVQAHFDAASNVIPEPSTILLAALGLLGLLGCGRRRRRA